MSLGMGFADSSVLDEDHWYSLVSTISGGRCTLMLGPEAVFGSLGASRLPIHVALATYMKEQIPPEVRSRLGTVYDRLDPNHPASVAQAVLREADPAQIQRWLENFRRSFVVEEQPLLDLAGMPFELVIDTSPAGTVAELFARDNDAVFSTYYDRNGPAEFMLPELSSDRPIVYQLYGSVENPTSMILSDTDRLELIVSLARSTPALPANLTSALHGDVNRSFLFLGFDLMDWHFRVLLHILSTTRSGTTRPSHTSSARPRSTSTPRTSTG